MASESLAENSLNFSVSYRGQTHNLNLPADTPVLTLQVQLNDLTGVPPTLQKLIYKGKKAQKGEDATIADVGIKNGAKVQLLGTTTQELDGLKSAESEQQRRERIMRERAMKPQYKVRFISDSLMYHTHQVIFL